MTANGVTQGYEYNALGANSTLIDSNGNRTEFVLNHWGRITGIRKADGSEETYEYDLMENMLKSTDGNGFSVSYRYDTRGNMVTRIDATGAREHFLYDKEV